MQVPRCLPPLPQPFTLTLVSLLAAVGSFILSPVRSDELSDRLRPLLEQHRGQVTVAIKHLDRGTEFAHQADAVMPTASLIKLPVMLTAYRLVDEGKLDLNRVVTLKAEDKVPGSGILTTHFSPGAKITVRDAIRLMIAFSDNTATNLVLEEIGLKTTSEVMEQLGYRDTKIHAKVFRGDTSIFPERSKQFGLGSTTSRQMIQLLEQIHRKQAASASSCDEMIQHMLACEDKNKLVRNLPAGIRVAHKTGSVNAVRTDAGILLTPGGPIAICVLTSENEDKRWTNDNAAEVLCGQIARVVYDHFNPANAPTKEESPAPLSVGSTGPLVESLQRTLNTRLTPSPELNVDGNFGPVTRTAVVRFQQSQGIPATGVVNQGTWQALGPLQVDAIPVPDPAALNAAQLPQESAEDLAAPPLITGKAWAIADARTGVLLWGQNERQRLHFASTTKIMTAYVVLSLAEKDPAVLNEVVTFSQRADNTSGSTSELRAGEKLPVHELLYGLLLPSGNDASVALGEHFGSRFTVESNGNQADPLQSFIAEMNRTAHKLGMRDTEFRNTHGLTHADHQSTAADLIVLTHAARQLPRFREYTSTRQHGATVSSTVGYVRNLQWRNTNRLLSREGYLGVKTGTTDAAGACLVACGQFQGDELLVVVLGSASSDARYVDARNLFRWAWNQRR